MSKTITQQQLKLWVHYNKDTGVFTRIKVKVKNQIKVGDILSSKKGKYLTVAIDNVHYYLHTLAWLYEYGYLPKELDHINQIGNDNRIINLREIKHSENMKNLPIQNRNKSGHTGVYKARYGWKASIRVKYKLIHLGYFKEKSEAVNARKHAEKLYHFHVNHGTC